MNNLKYKGLVIPAVPWTEGKRFSWEKTEKSLVIQTQKSREKQVLRRKKLGENSIV